SSSIQRRFGAFPESLTSSASMRFERLDLLVVRHGSPPAPRAGSEARCLQFQLSGWNLDRAAEGYRQGRVASRRTLSPRPHHRDEHEPPGRAVLTSRALAYSAPGGHTKSTG